MSQIFNIHQIRDTLPVVSRSASIGGHHAIRHHRLLPALAFCASSLAMIMLNKAAMTSFHLSAPACLVLFQCSMTPVYVLIWCALGFHETPRLERHTLAQWLPVNILFVGMIWTSFLALRSIGIATCTVLKNLTNFLVISGDYFFFNKVYSMQVWITVFLMLLSALCSAITDLEFSVEGYTWQMVNNIFTAAYSLCLRAVIMKMERNGKSGSSKHGMDGFTMVMYNNVLSVPLLCIIVLATGDFQRFLHDPVLNNQGFQLVAFVSSVVGFLISLSSMWFLSTTTATTFSLVGSLNKIPMAILGMLLFHTPVSFNNLMSIGVGLAAGVLFVHAKAGEHAKSVEKPES